MRQRFGLRSNLAGLTVTVVAAAGLVVAGVALAAAISSTDNPGVTQPIATQTAVVTDTNGTTTEISTLNYVTQACVHGTSTNCNAYANKRDVWASGLPIQAALGEGDYFLAVLDPGGQRDPNDGAGGNLSTSDTYVARSFHVDGGGAITPLGGSTHPIVNGLIQAFPFDDTANNGGVYILAVCEIPSAPSTGPGAPGVDPSDCKYDAFKVGQAAVCTANCTGIAVDPSGLKTATPAFTRSFTWTISKSVDKPIVKLNPGGTATFTYTVTVTPTGHYGSYGVTGKITVTNQNGLGDDVTGVIVTDAIDGETHATCVVSNGSADGGGTYTVDPTNATIPGSGSVVFPYSCLYTQKYANASQTNRATIAWPSQFLAADNAALVGNSTPATASIDWTSVTPSLVDDCTNVTDTLDGTTRTLASSVCVGSDGTLPSTDGHLVTGASYLTGVTGTLNPTLSPYTSLDLKYSYSPTTPAVGACVDHKNTSTYTTDDTPLTGDSSQVTVTVCNFNAPFTLGYWGNHMYKCATKEKTGTNGCNTNGPYTDSFLGQSVCTAPNACTAGQLGSFTATGTAGLPSTALGVFNANNCSNASTSDSNAAACLAAQLLAAELDVANKADVCVCNTIHAANLFLAAVGYNGPGSKVTFDVSHTRAMAITLKTALDNYNNNRGCPSS